MTKNKTMKVYAFMYNPMTEESCYGVVSLHKTKEGAKKAARKHKAKQKRMYEVNSKGRTPILPFGKFEHWFVQEYKILD